jgi:hypothetical protein
MPRRTPLAVTALAAVLLAGAPSAHAAEAPGAGTDGPKNTLTVSPTGLVSGLVALEYERVVSDGVSLTFAPDLRLSQPLSVTGTEAFTEGDRVLTLSAGARFFVLGRAPSGLWLSPEVGSVMGLTRVGDRQVQEWALPRFAATLGVTGVVGGWLTLSAGAGVQAIAFVPMPNVRLNAGFAF